MGSPRGSIILPDVADLPGACMDSGQAWPTIMQQHSAAPSSTQQHPAAPSSTQQHPAAPSSSQQHPAAPSSTQHPGVAPRRRPGQAGKLRQVASLLQAMPTCRGLQLAAEIEMRRLGAKECFGESELLDGQGREQSARCASGGRGRGCSLRVGWESRAEGMGREGWGQGAARRGRGCSGKQRVQHARGLQGWLLTCRCWAALLRPLSCCVQGGRRHTAAVPGAGGLCGHAGGTAQVSAKGGEGKPESCRRRPT